MVYGKIDEFLIPTIPQSLTLQQIVKWSTFRVITSFWRCFLFRGGKTDGKVPHWNDDKKWIKVNGTPARRYLFLERIFWSGVQGALWALRLFNADVGCLFQMCFSSWTLKNYIIIIIMWFQMCLMDIKYSFLYRAFYFNFPLNVLGISRNLAHWPFFNQKD